MTSIQMEDGNVHIFASGSHHKIENGQVWIPDTAAGDPSNTTSPKHDAVSSRRFKVSDLRALTDWHTMAESCDNSKLGEQVVLLNQCSFNPSQRRYAEFGRQMQLYISTSVALSLI